MTKIPVGYKSVSERNKALKVLLRKQKEADIKISETLTEMRRTDKADARYDKLRHTLFQLENSYVARQKEIDSLRADAPQFFKVDFSLDSQNKRSSQKSIQQQLKERGQKNKLDEFNRIHASARRERDLAKKTPKLRQIEREKIIENRKFSRELQKDKDALRQFSGLDISTVDNMKRNEIDVFISHASEDKDSVVRELAESLISQGVGVWYDEYSLSIGDSLSSSINSGLSMCTFGIVVLSPYFIKKKWPEIELQSLYAKEVRKGKSILPIWHRITYDEVYEFNLHLADKYALNTSTHSVKDITTMIVKELDKRYTEFF